MAATVEFLPHEVALVGVKIPAPAIVGEVVALRERLAPHSGVAEDAFVSSRSEAAASPPVRPAVIAA
ncbi:MAG: hypothetical protein AABM64_09965 [Pseudomonadota bacterium]